jgi:hypothetical protein
LRLLNAGPLGAGRFLWRSDRAEATVRGFPGGGAITAVTAPSLLRLTDARYVRIERIGFFGSTGPAVEMHGASHVALSDCYVGLAGANGIVVDGGDHVTIDRCVIADIGGTAVRIGGGDRAGLVSSGHRLADSTIVRFGLDTRTYAPGARIYGVGVEIARNTFAAGPHSAIIIAGNDHLIAGNDIGQMVCEARDAGAIYLGRDWSARGTRIRGNLIHDSGSSGPGHFTSAVYLDDQASGTIIEGNAILRTGIGVVIGGGRDNVIAGNVIAGTPRAAIYIDDRGTKGQGPGTGVADILMQNLRATPYTSELWRRRYPGLAAITRPGPPEGNRAIDNAFVGSAIVTSGEFARLEEAGSRSLRTASTGIAALRLLTRPPLQGIGPAARSPFPIPAGPITCGAFRSGG